MTLESTGKKSRGSVSSIRWTIQLIFLAATFLVGLRHILPGEGSKGGAFDAFCPFGAVETLWSYVTTGETLKTTSPLNFSIALGVLGVSLLAGRAFCGWMCPIGTFQDILSGFSTRYFGRFKKPGNKNKLEIPVQITKRSDAWLRSFKYLILAVILLASIWAVYPPLYEICPARAIFSFQLTTPLLWSVLIIFVFTSMLNKRFWCKYLCPLGAVLVPFNKISPLRLVLNQENCTNCNSCEPVCPMDIDDLTHNLRSAECIQCLECQEACKVHNSIDLRLF